MIDHICWTDDTYCEDCGPITTPLLDPEPAWESFIDHYARIFGYDRQKEEA